MWLRMPVTGDLEARRAMRVHVWPVRRRGVAESWAADETARYATVRTLGLDGLARGLRRHRLVVAQVCPQREYQPRRPEQSTLYRVVARELHCYLSEQAALDCPVPDFVRSELRSYLECGILARREMTRLVRAVGGRIVRLLVRRG